jgi:tetratricopeptide (TPR) repeat protein
MLRYFLLLFLLLSAESIAYSQPEDEVDETLARAETLYYEAAFKEAIQLLLRVDGLLHADSGRLKEKISVRLHLALAHIGLNENAEAKSFLLELYALDADYQLDPRLFPPKMLALAEEAKTEQNEIRCEKIGGDAHRELESHNVTALANLIVSTKSNCPQLDAIKPDAADLLYETGVELYKRGELSDALRKFRTAVELSPTHELALQYIELARGKLQLFADQLFLEWQQSFEAREFTLASAEYHQLISFDEARNNPMLNRMRAEYRKALSTLLESWKQACSNGDAATMDTIRRQVSELLPEPSIGEDILAQMTNCKS